MKIFNCFYKEYAIGDNTLEVGSGEEPIDGVMHPTDKDPDVAAKNPKIGVADVLHLPFADKQFDVVLARNFISCFDCIGRPDLKEKALAEMRRVGKAVFVREYNKKLCLVYWKYLLRRKKHIE